MMGMEHERIHVETSSVLIRQLPVTMVQPPPQWVTAPHSHGRLWCGLLVNGLLRHISIDFRSFSRHDSQSYRIFCNCFKLWLWLQTAILQCGICRFVHFGVSKCVLVVFFNMNADLKIEVFFNFVSLFITL